MKQKQTASPPNDAPQSNGQGEHTPGKWDVYRAMDGYIYITSDTNDIARIESKHPFETVKANAALIASAPQLKAENENLKAQKDIAMRIALEFGYKECEKGNNLEMAFINYEKAIAKHQNK